MAKKSTPAPAADAAIEWVDAPPGTQRRDVQGFVAALQANPGQWAIHARDTTHRGTATYLRHLGCQVKERSNGDGTMTVYARWPEA
jgi:hypothetical protein